MKYSLLSQSVNLNGQTIQGPLDSKIGTLGDLISRILTFLMPAAGLILLFVLIWGGVDFMTAQGNAEKIKSAWGKITSGLIGFILLISSYLIVRLIAKIFGLESGIL